MLATRANWRESMPITAKRQRRTGAIPEMHEERVLNESAEVVRIKPPMRIVEKRQVLSAAEMDQPLQRLAYEIVEKSGGTADLALIAVRRRGVPLAERLAHL